MPDRDTIIVGAGLAGLHLAFSLRELGERPIVFADAGSDRTSSVAAGVLNPVTGPRLARSWNVDTLLPRARDRYRRLEDALGAGFFHGMEIRRFCLSESERAQHARRREDPDYADYLGPLDAPDESPSSASDAFGSFRIRGAGYVDLPAFLAAAEERLEADGALARERFDHGALRLGNGDAVAYGAIEARRAVFCEGPRSKDNPWFDWLGFRPVKGETLTLSAERPPPMEAIYHHRKWALPRGHGTYRVGSTYERNFAHARPTEAGREALLAGWRAMFPDAGRIDVLDQRAGIRPCSLDRQPYAGPHPRDPRLCLFNGLGSKGALYAPGVAERLARHLALGEPLDPELRLDRFKKHAPR